MGRFCLSSSISWSSIGFCLSVRFLLAGSPVELLSIELRGVLGLKAFLTTLSREVIYFRTGNFRRCILSAFCGMFVYLSPVAWRFLYPCSGNLVLHGVLSVLGIGPDQGVGLG